MLRSESALISILAFESDVTSKTVLFCTGSRSRVTISFVSTTFRVAWGSSFWLTTGNTIEVEAFGLRHGGLTSGTSLTSSSDLSDSVIGSGFDWIVSDDVISLNSLLVIIFCPMAVNGIGRSCIELPSTTNSDCPSLSPCGLSI